MGEPVHLPQCFGLKFVSLKHWIPGAPVDCHDVPSGNRTSGDLWEEFVSSVHV